MKQVLIILFPLFLTAACVQTVHYSARDESFVSQGAEQVHWRRIVILPFTGEPAFRRVSAEWFSFKVSTHELYEIISPSLAEIELSKQGIRFGDPDIPLAEALKAGRLLGADGIAIGSIQKQELPGFTDGPRVAGVSLIDASTGKVVATSLQSRVVLTFTVEKRALASVDAVVEDLLSVLYAGAGRRWTAPVKTETQQQEPWRRP